MFKVKKFVDLSWPLTKDTPIYPGDPEPNIEVATTIENEGFNLSSVFIGTQTGTHVDAPYHFSNDGDTIDKMELDFFIGEAVVIPVLGKKANEEITMADIQPHKDKVTPGKIVMFYTNWDKKRGTDEFFTHPYLSVEVARFIADNGTRFVCIDTINVDKTGGTEFPVHDLFVEKRLVIGENMTGFDKIDFDDVVLAAFPMNIVGTDGSPVRAVAMEMA
ncbi:MAG: cyclase family protein [Oscillospiraceae bacterium]|nr:cyclase family protein [Oscillospiraceae bacterium]